VIEQVVADTEEALCTDLRPAQVTPEQFDETVQWVRDYLIAQAAAWQARCG
jgi:hypothetical protein